MNTADFAMMRATGAGQPGISADARAMMVFEAYKKQILVAYVLWFFLGWFGAHNFYLKRTGVAVAQLVLTLTAVGIVVVFFWLLVDAVLIPGWVRRENNRLIWMLGGGPPAS